MDYALDLARQQVGIVSEVTAPRYNTKKRSQENILDIIRHALMRSFRYSLEGPLDCVGMKNFAQKPH